MKIRWTMQCKSARLERDKRYSGQKSWVTSIVGESDKSTDLDAAKTAMQAESPADRCLRHKQRPYKKRIKLQNKKKEKNEEKLARGKVSQNRSRNPGRDPDNWPEHNFRRIFQDATTAA